MSEEQHILEKIYADPVLEYLLERVKDAEARIRILQRRQS